MPKKPASPATINPPEGWKDVTGLGVLRGRDSRADFVDLVNLNQVIAWYGDTRKIPTNSLVDRLVELWPQSPMSLYVTCAEDYATRHTVSGLDDFRKVVNPPEPKPPGTRIDMRGTIVGYENYQEETFRQAYERLQREEEQRKAQKLLEVEWPRVPSHVFESAPKKRPAPVVDRLAIAWADAHKLFGWGTLAAAGVQDAKHTSTDAPPAKKLKQHELAPEWTGQRLKNRKAELKRDGVKDFIARLSKESGLPMREVSRRIKSSEGVVGNMATQLRKVAR